MADVTMWTGRHVKALREATRKTQQQVAEDLTCAQRTVSFWESRPTAKVSIAFQARLDMVLLNADHGTKRRFHELTGDPDVNRRDFLASTAAVVGMSTMRGEYAPIVTPDAIEHLRTTVHSAMQLDDKLGSNTARPIIQAQAETCTTLLRDCPPSLKRALHSLTGEATASRAWAVWDQGDAKGADEMFQLAYRHAEEAGDTDVAAGILCHRTQLAVNTHRYARGADLADAMLLIPARDGRVIDFRRLCAAQAFAAVGRNQDAWIQLRRVTDEHAEQTTPDESYCYYQSRWTTGVKTARCLTLSGDLASAADTLQTILPRIPAHAKRDQALSNLHLAEAAAVLDIDRACAAASTAVDLCRGTASPRVRQAYADTRARLDPWASARSVRQLDDYATGILA
ncbi:helix-turn-helix transcriptional regulator [Nocardia wallacei]|uniref:helix-turn-helix transcriptional regulator n=1 Tax=Nocardia wallacei TaxID=480035 RepID=UPI002455DBEA|nr:helix-turn-helix transcriptional regulator [Nocardia wallacei]